MKRSKFSEDDLQEQVVTWFRLQYPKEIIFSIPNGARTSISVAKKLKKTGLLRGVPDLFIPHVTARDGGLFIEMKLPKNYPTEHQKVMLIKLEKLGYRVEIAKSFDQFQDIVKFYLSCCN